MKTSLFKTSATVIAGMLAAALCTSCVREDTHGCVQYSVRMKVVDAQGNDLTESGVLRKADVYLFNEEGFVRMVPAGISEDFFFGEDMNRKLTLVAWGNIREDTLATTPIIPGTPIEEARIRLREHVEGSHLPVTDILYNRKELNNATTRGVQEESITLVLERMTAGVSIRTKYLAEYCPYDGRAYTFIVRGTGTEMDFTARITGETAGYRPLSTTDTKGDIYAPPFHIFPTGDNGYIEIDIYREKEKICTIAKDNAFKPLCAIAGKQTNIEIDFRKAEVKTVVQVVPWGEVDQDVEM